MIQINCDFFYSLSGPGCLLSYLCDIRSQNLLLARRLCKSRIIDSMGIFDRNPEWKSAAMALYLLHDLFYKTTQHGIGHSICGVQTADCWRNLEYAAAFKYLMTINDQNEHFKNG